MKISRVHLDFYVFLEKMVTVAFQGLTLSSKEGAAGAAFQGDACCPPQPQHSYLAPRGTKISNFCLSFSHRCFSYNRDLLLCTEFPVI